PSRETRRVTLDSLMFDGFAAADWPRVSVEPMARAESDIAAALDHDPSEAVASVALARLQAFRGTPARCAGDARTGDCASPRRPRSPALPVPVRDDARRR